MYLDKLEPLKVYLGGDPDALRSEAVRANEWRPTATVLVRCKDRFLVTQHIVRREHETRFVWKTKPDLPKGGVEARDDSVETAVYRELHEEVCLRRGHIRSLEYLGHTLVPFDRHNYGRDGFTLGKHYYLYYVTIDDQGHVSPGFDHGVQEIAWLTDPAAAFVKKGGKYTKKGKILTSPELQIALKGLRQAA